MGTDVYRLYGAATNEFSGTVRAYLRWKSLAYVEVVSVRPRVLTPDGVTLDEATGVIDEIECRHPEPTIRPSSPVQVLVAALLELYGDESHGAPCDALLLHELDAHFTDHDYILGSRPSAADFGLFGRLYAHQSRDPANEALVRRLAPAVARWFARMHEPPTPARGEFLNDDAVPATLWPVLARSMREQRPAPSESADQRRGWQRARAIYRELNGPAQSAAALLLAVVGGHALTSAG